MQKLWLVSGIAALALVVGCSGGDEDDGTLPAADTGGEDTGTADVGGDTGDTGADAEVGPMCGDGVLDSGEECDGVALGGASCTGEGFVSGDVSCSSECELVFDECVGDDPEECGDGVLQDGEECDGTDFGDATCGSRGFESGALACSAECEIVETGCESSSECGDGELSGDEECDDGNTDDLDGCDANCMSEYCGDGIVQPELDEECDTGGVAVWECEDLPGRPIGVQRCTGECILDTLLCPDIAACGNGDIDLGEACDDGNTADGDGCSSDCRSEYCGDGVLADFEACDGENLGGFDCSDFGFVAGEVICQGCSIDYAGCYSPACGDGEVTDGEECDDGNRESGDGCSRRCEVDGLEEYVFEELFGDLDQIESESSGAVIGEGSAYATQDRGMEATGDGSDGDWAPTDGESLASGEYNFSSVTLDGVSMTVLGDTVLRVTGDVNIINQSSLTVLGSLTIAVGGEINVRCSALASAGDLQIEQPSDAGIAAWCVDPPGEGIDTGSLSIANDVERSPGEIRVWSRGALDLGPRGEIRGGRNPGTGEAGDLDIRTYGDIRMEDQSLIIVGFGPTEPSRVEVFTEGDFVIDGGSTFRHEASHFGSTMVGVLGNIRIDRESSFVTNGAMPVTFRTEGHLEVLGGSIIELLGSTETSHRLIMEAWTLVLQDAGIVNAGGTGGEYGGPVEISLGLDALLGFGDEPDWGIVSGRNGCTRWGDTLIEANGDIIATGGSIIVEDPQSSVDCTDPTPGSSFLYAAGSAFVSESTVISTVESIIESEADVEVELDSEVIAWQSVSSDELEVESEPGWVIRYELENQVNEIVGLYEYDGEFWWLDELAGAPIGPEWRYDLWLGARMFDDAETTAFRVYYAAP